MRVLVTGHHGFIGGEFHRRLVKDGHTVRGWDVKDSLPVDVRDRRESALEVDLAIHCAAQIGSRAWRDDNPAQLLAADLAIDAAFFDWVLRTRPAHVVYFSSSAAYPCTLQKEWHHGRQLTERDVRPWAPQWVGGQYLLAEPDNVYGFVKLVGEHLAAQIAAAGIAVHVFRPFSGYGERQSLDYPMPAICQRAARGEDPLTVWGSGTHARDFIHVDDIVEAVLTAVREDVRGPVNLCSGEATTMIELADIAALSSRGYLVGAQTKPVAALPCIQPLPDMPEGTTPWRCGNPTRMLEFYTPKVPLHVGVRRMVDAYS